MVLKKKSYFWQFPTRSGVFSAYFLAWQCLATLSIAARYIHSILDQQDQSAPWRHGEQTSEGGSREGPVMRFTGRSSRDLSRDEEEVVYTIASAVPRLVS